MHEQDTGPATAHLQVTSARTPDYDNAQRGLVKLLALVGRLALPASLRFTIAAGDGKDITSWWTVTGAQAQVTQATEALQAAVATYMPWVDLAEAACTAPRTSPPASHWLRRADGDAPLIVSHPATAWTVLTGWPEPWALSVDLVHLPGVGAPVRRTPRAAEPDLAQSTPAVPGEGARECLCRILVCGGGPRRDLVASLLAEDTVGPVALVADPVRGPEPPADPVPPELVAHLLAVPGRLPGCYPEHAPVPVADLFASFAATASPHALILGGTGQGKTTLLAHLGDRASEAGEATAAVDVHDGALTRLLAKRIAERGQRPVLVELTAGGESRGVARQLNLLQPPPGLDTARWADDVFDIVRGVLWGDMPAEFFGPVGERALRACLHLLAGHQDGPRPLTDLPMLLNPADEAYRKDLLEGTPDPALRRVLQYEIMPMVLSKDPGNSLIWLLGKLEPLIGNQAVLACSTSGPDTIGVEDAIASGRPFLLHAPSAALGDSGSRILVAVVLHRLWLATRRRPKPEPLHLLLDEWHRYPAPTLASALTEGRKWGLRLRLANQNLTQIPAALRDAALANTGTLACFRTGPTDAVLVDGRYPRVTQGQLQRLPAHHVAVSTGDADYVAASPPPLPLEKEA